MRSIAITTIDAYVRLADNISRTAALTTSRRVIWFRGEPSTRTPLVPRLWRRRYDQSRELNLLQDFRRRAPAHLPNGPHREATDEWLLIARHVGLPTRLLDWTESALAALYFALTSKGRRAEKVVWVLDPLALNALSDPLRRRMLPLTWTPGNNPIAHNNIRCAWEGGGLPGGNLPVAIYPTYIHARLSAQRSSFTIHGINRDSIRDQLEPLRRASPLLARIAVRPKSPAEMLASLRTLGVAHTTMYPDLEHLVDELSEAYP